MPLFSTDPKHYEIFGDFYEQIRHLRRINLVLAGLLVLAIAGFFLMGIRPLVAVRVGTNGEATLISNVSVDNAPGAEEAQAFSRQCASYLLELTSGSVASNIAKGLRCMTADFSRAYAALVKTDPLLALLEKGNIRTVLSLDAKQTQIKVMRSPDGHPVRYFVTLFGHIDIHRADLNSEPVYSKPILINVTLLVVKRTNDTLNGLLVSFFEKKIPEDASPTLDVSPIPSTSKTTASSSPPLVKP